ncbi:MAG: sodium-dependent transporter [Spirochaetales bacterium]|nr:sodium-dependent transporter [Candidatus Physcosoma equi]
MSTNNRSSFSGKLGYVLAVAGSAVGMGNIWRFPYLAAKHGGAIFLFVYIILAATFGFAMVVTETALGRKSRKSPIGAFLSYGRNGFNLFGGWINAIVPILIIPYYSVIGGWVSKYLFGYLRGETTAMAQSEYFSSFISNSVTPEIWFIFFSLLTLGVIVLGVEKGIERFSKIMMPALLVLSVIISIYSLTRPNAVLGLKYLFVPNFKDFSLMTVVAALGQMFYSLSIAMGILITYGSYMKSDVDIEKATRQIEVFDTGIAILAAVMIIPAVFSYSGGDSSALSAGPGLMFVTLPKMFASMTGGRFFAILFFVLVLFAALTSSISLAETCVSTFMDEFHIKRLPAVGILAVIMLVLGSLSALGYGALSGTTIIGMQFLDFFDFLTNSLMMPISALCISIFVVYRIGLKEVSDEVKLSSVFRAEKYHAFILKYVSPICLLVIFVYSMGSAFGFF